MLDEILREAFRLARLRIRLIFLDLLWKVIWFVLTLAALLLVAAWFGSEFRSIGWMDTGNRAVNAALAFAVLRGFWAAHRTEMFAAVAAALFFSLVIWFVLQFFTSPTSGVAYMAHIGGFVFGLLVALSLRDDGGLRRRPGTLPSV